MKPLELALLLRVNARLVDLALGKGDTRHVKSVAK